MKRSLFVVGKTPTSEMMVTITPARELGKWKEVGGVRKFWQLR